MDRPRQAPRRFVALTAAISLHVLLMLALVSQSPSPPGPSSVNIIQLELRPTSGEPRRPPIERQPQGNTGPISPGPATPAPPAPVTPLPISLSANPSPPTPPREGEGLRRLTKENCDLLVSIPMMGSVESLNVSVASGVCLYEARRRRLK